MAKDNRHLMSTDTNDIDPSDVNAMTDQERETLQLTLEDMEPGALNRKRAM